MSQTKKRNIIIGALCGVLLLMVVGYAAFSTMLNINGTAKISSNWNVHFDTTRTTETNGVIVGSAGLTGGQKPTGTVTYDGNLTANVTADLIQPGDTVEYHLVVVNDGTIDAKLDKITPADLTTQKGSVIFTRSEELNVGDVIKAGETKPITVTIKYDSSVTSQLEKETVEFTLSLDFVQDIGNGGTVVPSEYAVYRNTLDDTLYIGDSIEGIETTTDPSSLGIIYLKHEIDSENTVVASYVCFVTDTEHCMQGVNASYYETNKALLQSQESWFIDNGGSCTFGDSYSSCSGGGFGYVNAFDSGYVDVAGGSLGCVVNGERFSYCNKVIFADK